MKDKVIIITGPTASGKTRFAIDTAKRFGGEIISADSMQIYKKMDIGTAKPTKEEREEAVHHLIDIIEPINEYTLSDYLRDCNAAVEDVLSRNKLPIIAGGTGLYISSFADNIKLNDMPNDPEYRKKLLDIANSEGTAPLREILKKVDIESYERLHENDSKRIIRALEVYKSSGKTITDLNRISKNIESPYEFFMTGLSFADRDKLYDRINLRVDNMIASGFIDEVRRLDFSGLSKTALQAIGYRQIHSYLNDLSDLGSAAESIKQESRRYAKRQLTWFRRDKRINWLYMDLLSYNEIFGNFVKALENFLKV